MRVAALLVERAILGVERGVYISLLRRILFVVTIAG